MPHSLTSKLNIEQLEDRLTPATLLPGFSEQSIAEGFQVPTAFTLAPDGRIFIAEKSGSLRVVDNGQLVPETVLSVNVDAAGERGLVGVVVDPNYATNNYLYVYYTVPSSVTGGPPFNRVSRFQVIGNQAVPGSETVLLDLDPLSTPTNHNGGALHFGPDGKLYVAVGEGGVPSNAQSLNTLQGKILRINPDGSIPKDNPFANQTTGKNQAIWALGLRNPFTFAFQPGTGRMFINDVGQASFEEINEGVAGANYGWPATEGPTNDPRFRSPLLAIPHDRTNGTGTALAGGAFYNPTSMLFPQEYVGDYFFGDFSMGTIQTLDPATVQTAPFASDIPLPVDLRVANDGSLYYLQIGSGGDTGALLRVIPNVPPTVPPVPSDRIAVGPGLGGGPVIATLQPTFGTPTQFADPRLGTNSGVRVTSADVNGDGIPDIIAGTGPGVAPLVQIYDGVTNILLRSISPFESTFTGGVFVSAGDINGDGVPELAITPDQGGGPRVRIFDSRTGESLVDFFGIDDPNFRGGARTALGDMNGDGIDDLFVAAGFGGGPRVAGYFGDTLRSGPKKMFGDFFAYDENLRNGTYLASGDINADGFADLVIGAGPGGGPRVMILNGSELVTNGQQDVIGNFFAGDSANRGGVPVAVKNLDGDALADVVTGTGPGVAPRVTAYAGSSFAPLVLPQVLASQTVFEETFLGGIYIG